MPPKIVVGLGCGIRVRVGVEEEKKVGRCGREVLIRVRA